MAEHTAANPNSADVLYTVAKEELKKFEVRLKKTSICSYLLVSLSCFTSGARVGIFVLLAFVVQPMKTAEKCLTALSFVFRVSKGRFTSD